MENAQQMLEKFRAELEVARKKEIELVVRKYRLEGAIHALELMMKSEEEPQEEVNA